MFKKLCAVVVVVSFLFISSVLAFDKTYGVVPEFDVAAGEVVNLDGTIVQVVTRGHGAGITPEHKWADGSFDMRGVGTVIQHKDSIYIVTAAHVVNPTQVTMRVDRYVHATARLITVYSREISVGNWQGGSNVKVNLFYMDVERDIALLKVENPKRWAYKAPASWPTSYLREFVNLGWGRVIVVPLVEEGDAIVLPVRVRNDDLTVGWTFELRKGKIVKPFPHTTQEMTFCLPFLSMWHMTVEMEAYPGDSGSPVLAFDKGKPVIIGILTAKIYKSREATEYYTYVTPIDYIKWIIEAEEAT